MDRLNTEPSNRGKSGGEGLLRTVPHVIVDLLHLAKVEREPSEHEGSGK